MVLNLALFREQAEVNPVGVAYIIYIRLPECIVDDSLTVTIYRFNIVRHPFIPNQIQRRLEVKVE